MSTLTLPLGFNEIVNVWPGTTHLQINAFVGDDVTVNLAAHSEWIGGWNAYPGNDFIIRGQGVWDNNGVTNTFGSTTVGVDVVGTGTIRAGSVGQLTFLHGVSVGAHQTVVVDGFQPYGSQRGTVEEVESPSLYHAFTRLGFGQLDLDGLHATSYRLGTNTLTLFNGSRIVDELGFSLDRSAGVPTPLVVSQTAAGVNIHTDGTLYTLGGVALHPH